MDHTTKSNERPRSGRLIVNVRNVITCLEVGKTAFECRVTSCDRQTRVNI